MVLTAFRLLRAGVCVSLTQAAKFFRNFRSRTLWSHFKYLKNMNNFLENTVLCAP